MMRSHPTRRPGKGGASAHAELGVDKQQTTPTGSVVRRTSASKIDADGRKRITGADAALRADVPARTHVRATSTSSEQMLAAG
jgi:hypothetical protein